MAVPCRFGGDLWAGRLGARGQGQNRRALRGDGCGPVASICSVHFCRRTGGIYKNVLFKWTNHFAGACVCVMLTSRTFTSQWVACVWCRLVDVRIYMFGHLFCSDIFPTQKAPNARVNSIRAHVACKFRYWWSDRATHAHVMDVARAAHMCEFEYIYLSCNFIPGTHTHTKNRPSRFDHGPPKSFVPFRV